MASGSRTVRPSTSAAIDGVTSAGAKRCVVWPAGPTAAVYTQGSSSDSQTPSTETAPTAFAPWRSAVSYAAWTLVGVPSVEIVDVFQPSDLAACATI